MEILKNAFDVEFDTWSDPGDYPNGIASAPLPSYDYVAAVEGELLLEIDASDLEVKGEFSLYNDEYIDTILELAAEHADIPSGIRVTEWGWSYPAPNKVSLFVQDFDASDYEPTGRDDFDEDPY